MGTSCFTKHRAVLLQGDVHKKKEIVQIVALHDRTQPMHGRGLSRRKACA